MPEVQQQQQQPQENNNIIATPIKQANNTY
jgi:hypothetical protein